MPTTGDNLGLTVSDTLGATGWNTWMDADLKLLDAVVFLDVISRVIATPPGSPAAGDRYLVAASPTGAWSGQAGKITVYRSGAWAFITPKEGWLLTSQADPGKLYKYESGAFVQFSFAGATAEDVATWVRGKPDASEVVLRYVATHSITFPANLTGSQVKAATASTASKVFSVQKNGSEFATVTISASGTTASFAGSSTSFAAGDVLTVVAPASQDTTLADIAITLRT